MGAKRTLSGDIVASSSNKRCRVRQFVSGSKRKFSSSSIMDSGGSKRRMVTMNPQMKVRRFLQRCRANAPLGPQFIGQLLMNSIHQPLKPLKKRYQRHGNRRLLLLEIQGFSMKKVVAHVQPRVEDLSTEHEVLTAQHFQPRTFPITMLVHRIDNAGNNPLDGSSIIAHAKNLLRYEAFAKTRIHCFTSVSNYCRTINGLARNNIPHDEIFQLSTALEYPVNGKTQYDGRQSGAVWRGLDMTYEQQLQQLQVGSIYTNNAFMSTAKDQSAAFQRNTLFEIHNTYSGWDVSNFTKYPEEQEILFGPGTKFRVIEVKPLKLVLLDDEDGGFCFVRHVVLEQI